MPTVPLRIPQIGEGLQEARLVAVLKQPGDPVRRDEVIYQMETDKAVMDVESPFAGTLLEWLAQADDVLPIGAEVARMEVEEAVETAAPAHTPEPLAEAAPVAPVPAGRRRDLPPRTRAYARELGLSEEEIEKVPAQGRNLLPADIDTYVAGRGDVPYTEAPLSPKQRVLASRLSRGSKLTVPGTMTIRCGWQAIESAREKAKAEGREFQPSAFTMFAYCVAQTAVRFPAVRSTLLGESSVRTFRHLQLGIAVALPEDELVLAVIENADSLSWPDFAQAARERIELARSGRDQATDSVTLSLTNMQAFGIRDAVAVVVPPAVATLFLGEVFDEPVWDGSGWSRRRVANLGITFDHRLLNGVGAAEFLNALRARVEGWAGDE